MLIAMRAIEEVWFFAECAPLKELKHFSSHAEKNPKREGCRTGSPDGKTVQTSKPERLIKMFRNTVTTALLAVIVSTSAAFADWSVRSSANTVSVQNGQDVIVVGHPTSAKEERKMRKEAKKLARDLNKAMGL